MMPGCEKAPTARLSARPMSGCPSSEVPASATSACPLPNWPGDICLVGSLFTEYAGEGSVRGSVCCGTDPDEGAGCAEDVAVEDEGGIFKCLYPPNAEATSNAPQYAQKVAPAGTT